MIQASRDLKEKISIAEQRLWEYFRDERFCNVSFKRHVVISPYIAHFLSPEHKIIIELSDNQSHGNDAYNARKIAHLKTMGYKVIHFWNHDVLHNIRVVLEVVHNEIDKAIESA